MAGRFYTRASFLPSKFPLWCRHAFTRVAESATAVAIRVWGRRLPLTTPTRELWYYLIFESLLYLPGLPNIGNQVYARLQGLFARLPAGRSDFGAACSPDQLEGLQLTQRLADVAAHRRSEHFKPLDNPIGINDEPAPGFHAAVFIVYAIGLADVPALVGTHHERDIMPDHLGQLVVIPYLVYEHAIDAYREHLSAQFLKLRVFGSNCCNFCRSDEGKITRVET